MLLERLLFKQIEPYLESPEAIIITGMRRTGKTSLLQFIYKGLTSSNKLFLDLENPLNQKYFSCSHHHKSYDSINFSSLKSWFGFNVHANFFQNSFQWEAHVCYHVEWNHILKIFFFEFNFDFSVKKIRLRQGN